MLVILAGDQILSPQQVCQDCLWADQRGQPRWHQGQLRCGKTPPLTPPADPPECPMGFRIVNIEP